MSASTTGRKFGVNQLLTVSRRRMVLATDLEKTSCKRVKNVPDDSLFLTLLVGLVFGGHCCSVYGRSRSFSGATSVIFTCWRCRFTDFEVCRSLKKQFQAGCRRQSCKVAVTWRIKRFWNRTFVLPNGQVYIDQNGERLPDILEQQLTKRGNIEVGTTYTTVVPLVQYSSPFNSVWTYHIFMNFI